MSGAPAAKRPIQSAAVGEANWTQEVDGQLGRVIGAKQRELTINKLSDAGDVFDFGTLCLQLSLVLGAIGLLLKHGQRSKRGDGASERHEHLR